MRPVAPDVVGGRVDLLDPAPCSASTEASTRHVSSCIISVGIGVPSQSRCTAAGAAGAYGRMLSALGVRSRLSRYYGNVSQSQGRPSFIDS
jgi:hypothetical protein